MLRKVVYLKYYAFLTQIERKCGLRLRGWEKRFVMMIIISYSLQLSNFYPTNWRRCDSGVFTVFRCISLTTLRPLTAAFGHTLCIIIITTSVSCPSRLVSHLTSFIAISPNLPLLSDAAEEPVDDEPSWPFLLNPLTRLWIEKNVDLATLDPVDVVDDDRAVDDVDDVDEVCGILGNRMAGSAGWCCWVWRWWWDWLRSIFA